MSTGTAQTGGSRAEVLARAADSGERHGWRESDLNSFLTRYYRHVPDEDLASRDPVDLAGAALSHRQLAAHRVPGTAAVRVHTPTVDTHGWQTGHTVVEIVAEDMPFLVDSVTNRLVQGDRTIHLVVHPVVVVRRDVTGELVEVLDLSTSALTTGQRDPSWPDDAVCESWMHLEVDREPDPRLAQTLREELLAVLDDVRTAVEDWPKMRAQAQQLADGLPEQVPQDLDAEALEAQRLVQWLVEENFTFLGYREYTLAGSAGEESLSAVIGTGLGILRRDPSEVSSSFERLAPRVRAKARERHVLILTKANSRATVHRSSYLDYVGVKVFGADGEVTGERRFLGLFTSAAYTESVRRVPIVDTKINEVLERASLSPSSHSGKDLLAILETFPRDELFQAGAEQIYTTSLAVLHLKERRRTRLFLRTDDYGRFVSALIFLPRDRYNTTVRLRMQQLLSEAFSADAVDYTTRVSESVLARLHYVLRPAKGAQIPDVDAKALGARLVEATRTWGEDLAEALTREVGEADSGRLLRTWETGFPEAYKEDFAARVAVGDLRRIEAAAADHAHGKGASHLLTSLYEPVGAGPDERRMKLFRREPLSLTTVLPYFRNLGIEVTDERPYEIQSRDGSLAYVYDFGLRYPGMSRSSATREMVTDALEASWAGHCETDGFNQLVMAAGLTWRQIVVLRTYAKYLRQTGSTFSQDYVEQCLLSNVGIARRLVALFEARLDPDLGTGPGHHGGNAGTGTSTQERAETADALVEEILAELDREASLDYDRILRAFLGMVRATVRTSFFQTDASGRPKDHVAVKLDPSKVPDLPAPRPAHEIWVYSPRVEGVHLRFGAVARGGLRWSDRREDFRTEVLGLVKAQTVKNAVIVPTGAKGGFVAKQLPDPATDREAWLAEGIASYTTFVSCLLDVTDDLVRDAGDGDGAGRRVEPPPRVVRHDDDDTYLVVAADKGTASFSDIANGIAAGYDFWLGDAFASGGSVGYDHKAMGITARGAWESVKRHFRELGHDTQTQPFTVVGVGDMSGDVFGNGMLLSEHIRLLAAFDHRHIFLDPDPDPATSFAERSRLFALARSSWQDYDSSLISAGGGVYPRTAKSVPISAEVAAALGLAGGAAAMTPAELMKAILHAPADLLWNGGIGTYVKASGEDHPAVGDKANDAIRVDGADLRVRVVGEGGNLGLTQLGRIEAALGGVRVNTDAIDNSAGVDCSDHEVNIKILLDQVVADGDLTMKQRNALLAEMTDEVGRLVLRDNYEQNVLLGNARRQSLSMVAVHARLIKLLEQRGELDRGLEFLPTARQIAQRESSGTGLTSPEFSVLVAYSKIALSAQVLASSIPDEPWFQEVLRRYFPQPLVDRYPERLQAHPLRRQIITTWVANDLVNRGGITFAFRAMEETGASADQVVRAYVVARQVYGLEDYVARVEALDNVISTDMQTDLYLEMRRLVDRAARWLVQNRPGELDVQAEIERFATVVGRWRGGMAGLLVGADMERMSRGAEEMVQAGVDEETAARASGLLDEFSLLDVAELAAGSDEPVELVAQVYFEISARYGIDGMLSRISRLGRNNRWESLARGAMRDDMYAAWMGLTSSVLVSTDGTSGSGAQERLDRWEKDNASQLARARATIDEVRELETGDLASMSVALRVLRGVIRAGSAS